MTSTFRFTILTLLALASIACAGKPAPPPQTPTDQISLRIASTESPAGTASREPDLTATADGRILLSWVQQTSDKRYALKISEHKDGRWSEPRAVAEGENWFVNWADFPSVIALADGSLAAHWLVKSGTGKYAYDVNISVSKDGGRTWSKPVVPHRDETETEHGFVSLLPLTDGKVGAIWLDGRNFKEVEHSSDHGSPDANMTLRYAAIDAAGTISDEKVLDERVCECCQTSATMTSDGPIAVYRDRSEDEVRDISVVRYRQGAWQSPQTLAADRWKINACPVNGPAIVADGKRVAVAWFTEANDEPKVQVAFSNDAGATFGNAVRVDEGQTIGRVDVVLMPDGSALVCWLSGTVEGGELRVRRVQANGLLGQSVVLAKTDISRSSGFPRMARRGSEVHFAWTEFGKPSHVRTAVADLGAGK